MKLTNDRWQSSQSILCFIAKRARDCLETTHEESLLYLLLPAHVWDSNRVSVEPASKAFVLVEVRDISKNCFLSKMQNIIRFKQLIPLYRFHPKDLS
jgi:hypothetical protein